MKLMIKGTWRGDVEPTPEFDAQRMIHAGRFRGRVAADGSSEFRAEAGRYHPMFPCPPVLASRHDRARGEAAGECRRALHPASKMYPEDGCRDI
jgi:hypothetical protein